MKPQMRDCYGKISFDTKAWCCSDHSKKSKVMGSYESFTMNGKVACMYSTMRRKHVNVSQSYTQRCCLHGPSKPAIMNIDQLPDFIIERLNSVKIDDDDGF